MHAHKHPPTLIAVDIGNSRIKLGQFDRAETTALPEPHDVLELPLLNRSGKFDVSPLAAWCSKQIADASEWLVGGVHQGAVEHFTTAVAHTTAESGHDSTLSRLTYRDLPMKIDVVAPERLGIDRLLSAYAAEAVKPRDRAAIVLDLGTAITADLITEAGTFAGGAILPGLAMSARALHEQTDALPLVTVEHWNPPPPPIGRSTEAAIESGLLWGTVGAIRELVERLAADLSQPPLVLVSGGAAALLVDQLGRAGGSEVRHLPHLVLSGIALLGRGN